MQSRQPLTGIDLKVERVRADVPLKDVARQMGVSSSRLSRIEDQERLTDSMRERYLSALETCRTFRTRGAA